MKRKISFLLAWVMVLTMLAILTAVPAAADEPTAPAVVGYQVTLAYTDDAKLVRNLRFVAKGWDADKYQKVGFSISYEGMAGDPWDKSSTKVFESLTGQTSDGKTMDTYTAESFSADYLYALSILKAPTGANTFYVTPYAIKLDGTKVTGETAVCNVAVSNVALTIGENLTLVSGNGTQNGSNYEMAYNKEMTVRVADESLAALPSAYRYFCVLYSVSGSSSIDNIMQVKLTNGKTMVEFSTGNSDTDRLSAVFGALSNDEYNRFTVNKNGFNFKYLGHPSNGGTFVLKKIYFFASAADAATYASANSLSGGNAAPTSVALNFGSAGNLRDASSKTKMTEGTDCYNFSCGGFVYTNAPEYSLFSSAAFTSSTIYARVYYSISGSSSSANAIEIRDGGVNNPVEWTGLGNTDGYVLSEAVSVNSTIFERMFGTNYRDKCFVMFNYKTSTVNDSGVCSIKTIYFFTSEAEANAFSIS